MITTTEIIISQIESPNTHLHSYPPTESTSTRSLTLSRTLATPNIKYKGTLRAREVEVPELGDMNGGGRAAAQGIGSSGGTELRGMGEQVGREGTAGAGPRRPLIEELPDKGTEQIPGDAETGEPQAQRWQSGEETGHELKSILKHHGEKSKEEVNEREKEASEKTDIDEMNGNGEAKAEVTQSKKGKPRSKDTLSKTDESFEDPHVVTVEDTAREVPVWRWDKKEGAGRKMIIEVPKFVCITTIQFAFPSFTLHTYTQVAHFLHTDAPRLRTVNTVRVARSHDTADARVLPASWIGGH